WTGWIKPENLTKDYILDQYELSVSATDGLADLKDVEFNNFNTGNPYVDRATVLVSVRRILEHIEILLGFKIQLGVYETVLMTNSQNAIEKATIDSLRFTKIVDGREVQKNCFLVLEEILRTFGVVMFQSEGFWWIQSKRERNSNVFEYNSAGTLQSTTLIDVSYDITNFDFRGGNSLERLPPIKQFETTLKNKNINLYLNRFL
ncbi:MAG: hypothetical protein IIB07_02750, partial [Bacteroidetes bacterium]|nr:hypothetical protein [Bacteroidota bacterium]